MTARLHAQITETLTLPSAWERAGIELTPALRAVLEERAGNLAQWLGGVVGELLWCPVRDDYFPRALEGHQCDCGRCVGCGDDHQCEECVAEDKRKAGVR